jgi:hypothetical protein
MKNTVIVDGPIARILLKRKDGDDLYTTIDREDLQRVVEFTGNRSWCAQWNPCIKSFYAITSIMTKGKRVRYALHRFVTNCPITLEPDHINHDTLDNRKVNLKVGTRLDNMKNRQPRLPFGRCYYKNFSREGWTARVQCSYFRQSVLVKTEHDAEQCALFLKEEARLARSVITWY